MSRYDKYMVHVDIGTDEKLADLTDSERLCHVVGVLAVAAKSPIRGYLIVGDAEATPAQIGRRAAVPEKTAAATVAKLTAVGVLVRDEAVGALHVHNWEKFNPPPKNDPTNAERQARWRARNGGDNADGNGAGNTHVTTGLSRTGADAPADARSGAPAFPRRGVEVEEEVEEEATPLLSGLTADEQTDPEISRLSNLLADLILQRAPAAKVAPDGKRWLKAMRLLVADLNGNIAEVERVLRWSQVDPFWQANILSPDKLRAQFTQLTLKMKTAPVRLAGRDPEYEEVRAQRAAAFDRLMNGDADVA